MIYELGKFYIKNTTLLEVWKVVYIDNEYVVAKDYFSGRVWTFYLYKDGFAHSGSVLQDIYLSQELDDKTAKKIIKLRKQLELTVR